MLSPWSTRAERRVLLAKQEVRFAFVWVMRFEKHLLSDGDNNLQSSLVARAGYYQRSARYLNIQVLASVDVLVGQQ